MQARKPRNRKTRNAILSFIRDFPVQHGRQPSVREIGAAVGLSSTSTTAGYLSRMVRDGLLGRVEGKYHNYYVIDPAMKGESA